MSYIDQTYLNNAIGSTRVAALCPSTTEVTTVIELAEALVESAVKAAGYDSAVPSSVYTDTTLVPKQIKLAAVGAWLILAHARHNRTVPADDNLKIYMQAWTAFEKGQMDIPGLASSVNTARAMGGIVATETDPTVSVEDGSRPQVFNRSTLAGR